MKPFIIKTALFGLALLCLSGCTPMRATHGNMLQDYQLQQIQAGVDTQTDILRKLGSPTTKAPFDENVWYYMGQETEKSGIFDPQVTKERIVAVTFGADGIVSDVQDVKPRRQDINYVEDKTPTSGHDMNALQQLFGNMGRFNKDPNKKAPSEEN